MRVPFIYETESVVITRSQSASEPLAAKSRKDVVAADERVLKEQDSVVPQSSARDAPTAMASAEDMRQQEPYEHYSKQPAYQQTTTEVPAPKTKFSEALSWRTLLDGTGSRRDSVDAVLEKLGESDSLHGDEHEDSPQSPTMRGRLPRVLAALIDMHTSVLTVRVNTEELRTKLKTRRHAVGELDAEYMLAVEDHFAYTSVEQVADLKGKLRQLQLAKAELLALEEEYEEEETQLVQSEADLRDLEFKLYGKLAEPPANADGQESVPLPESDWDEQLLPESELAEWDEKLEHPPEVRAYLSQQGYVNMLRERLMDKDTQYVQVTEENALREEIGREPEADTEEFLASFEAERELLAAQLRDAESLLVNLAANLDEPENLRTRGNPFADFDRRPDGPSREHSLFGKDDYYDEEIVQRGRLANARVLDAAAALMLTVDDPQLVYAHTATDADGVSIDKASYINSWQLHRLRKSTREVARLIQEQEDAGVLLSPRELKANVLETWMQDETTHYSEFSHFEIQARDLSMATHSGVSLHSRPASAPPVQAWQTTEHLLQRRLSTSHAETTR
jgi:hypothetical protein